MADKQKQEDEEFDEWFNKLSEEEQTVFDDVEDEVVKDLDKKKDKKYIINFYHPYKKRWQNWKDAYGNIMKFPTKEEAEKSFKATKSFKAIKYVVRTID